MSYSTTFLEQNQDYWSEFQKWSYQVLKSEVNIRRKPGFLLLRAVVNVNSNKTVFCCSLSGGCVNEQTFASIFTSSTL